MFRLGITASSPASLIKLKPHKLKYVWNGSGDDPGHLENPPVITSCVSNKYLDKTEENFNKIEFDKKKFRQNLRLVILDYYKRLQNWLGGLEKKSHQL